METIYTGPEEPEYLATDYNDDRNPVSVNDAVAEVMQQLHPQREADGESDLQRMNKEIMHLEIQSTYGYPFDDERLQWLRKQVANEQAKQNAPQTE